MMVICMLVETTCSYGSLCSSNLTNEGDINFSGTDTSHIPFERSLGSSISTSSIGYMPRQIWRTLSSRAWFLQWWSFVAASISAMTLSLLSTYSLARVLVFLFTTMDKEDGRGTTIRMNFMMMTHVNFTRGLHQTLIVNAKSTICDNPQGLRAVIGLRIVVGQIVSSCMKVISSMYVVFVRISDCPLLTSRSR